MTSLIGLGLAFGLSLAHSVLILHTQPWSCSRKYVLGLALMRPVVPALLGIALLSGSLIRDGVNILKKISYCSILIVK